MFPPSFNRRTQTANLMLLAAAFIWGATFVFIKAALWQIGPFTFLAARFWLAFVVLAPIFFNRLRRNGRSLWRAGGVLGLVLCAAYAFPAHGQLIRQALFPSNFPEFP